MKKAREEIKDALWHLEWMVLDEAIQFLATHSWAKLTVTVFVSAVASFLTILLLSCLGLAGCIPLPWWL